MSFGLPSNKLEETIWACRLRIVASREGDNIKNRFNQYQANHNSSSNAGAGGFAGLVRSAVILVILMAVIWLWVSMR